MNPLKLSIRLSEKHQLSQSLRTYIDRQVECGVTHGLQLSLTSTYLDFFWRGAAGLCARRGGCDITSINVNQPIRIASNTKTFVAAAILRSWEQQLIGLDDTIEKYLSTKHIDMIYEAGYLLNKITVRHLLSHTSGLFDYGDSPQFMRIIRDTPDHRWSRTDQLYMGLSSGNAYGLPGNVFRYSDTGYILLGEILENVSGKSLPLALRSLLDYGRIGLKSTWMESLEPAPEKAQTFVHQYEGELDIRNLHPSCDLYGGGGLVSTVDDMACFMRALFSGRVYHEPFTLFTMLSSVDAPLGGSTYGVWHQVPNTYRLGIDGGSDGRVFYHRGHFGTIAGYVPELDLAFGLSLNNAQEGSQDFRELMLRDILKLFGFKY